MSLPNTALWGDILPGGPLSDSETANLDTTQVIDELLPTLHAQSRDDLTWWSERDLIEWIDEALKRLARTACVFVGRSTATLTAPGQPTYALPPGHISTLHVSYGTTPLRPANVNELAALDDQFRTRTGTPSAWYQDQLGGEVIGLAKVPDAETPLPQIYEGFPPALDAGKQQTMVAAPSPLKAYFAMAVLAEAYGREGEVEAPEIAEHCRARLAFYDALLTTYYGKGQ